MNKSSLRKLKTQIGCLKFFDWKEDKPTNREKRRLVRFGFHCNVKSVFLKKRIFCGFLTKLGPLKPLLRVVWLSLRPKRLLNTITNQ